MDTRSRTLLGGLPEIPQVPIGDGLDTPGSQNIIRTFSPLGRPHDTVYNPDPLVCSTLINKHVYTYSLKLLTISTFVILLVDQDGLVSSKDTR